MLDFFTAPKSVILYGISRKEDKSGNFVARNMFSYNPKYLYIVHPQADEINNIKCIKSLEELPDEIKNNIDLAIIAVPVKFVTETTVDCIKHGVKGILIESGNIGNTEQEINENRKIIQNSLKINLTVEGNRSRIMGPNSLGVFNSIKQFFTGIMDLEILPPFSKSGNNISIIAQTGLVVSGYFTDFFERIDIGVSRIYAIGNKMDINECDVIEDLLADDGTKTICMYLEDIKDGRRFYELCKKAIFEKEKIIVLLKSGCSELGKKAIMSHTNSLAGNSAILNGICQQLGIIQVSDLKELILAGKLCSNLPLPKGNSIGLISISGAGCVLSADLAERFGFHVPELNEFIIAKIKSVFPDWADINHPLDLWASIEQFGAKRSYNTVLKAFLESKLFDSIVFCNIGGKRTVLDHNFIKNLVAKYSDVPLILQIFGGFTELRNLCSKEFESINNVNNNEINGLKLDEKKPYIPVVYDLERTMKILSQLIKLSNLKKFKRVNL